MTHSLNEPARAETVLVMAMFCGRSNVDRSNTSEIYWIAKQNGTTADEEYGLWDEEVRDDERPVDAAARCLNEQVLRPQYKGWVDTSLIYPAGEWRTDSGRFHGFFIPFFLIPKMLRRDHTIGWLPLDLIDEFERKLKPDTVIALQHMPDRLVKLTSQEPTLWIP